jgi:hypothetical protein
MAMYDLNATSGGMMAGGGLMGEATGDLGFAGVNPDPQASTGYGSRTVTQNTPNPMQDLLMKTILQQGGTMGKIPEYTMQALQNFTENPSAAAEYFPDLAKPLLSSLKPAEDAEVTQLTDMFRKAGGTSNGAMQSGAFAQAGRQLIGDQANRRQEMLAKNYTSLTDQLSGNMNNAIKAGLQVPGATADYTKTLAGLATGLDPLQTFSETGGMQSALGNGTAVTSMNNNAAANDAAAQNWYDWWNS